MPAIPPTSEATLVRDATEGGPNGSQLPGDERGRSEKNLDKIDEIFGDLLDTVKDRPEAEQEALKILIGEMRQSAEDMREVRNLEHLQEMKEAMLANWQRLKEAAGGDPVLLTAIQQWGKRFAAEDVIYHAKMEAIKIPLNKQGTEIANNWSDMQATIGQIIGSVGSEGLDLEIQGLLTYRSFDFNKLEAGVSAARSTRSHIDDYLQSIYEVSSGFEAGDLETEAASAFSTDLSNVVRRLSVAIYSPDPHDVEGRRPIDKYPDLKELLATLIEQRRTLDESMTEASNLFIKTKSLRDTHFLELFAGEQS